MIIITINLPKMNTNKIITNKIMAINTINNKIMDNKHKLMITIKMSKIHSFRIKAKVLIINIKVMKTIEMRVLGFSNKVIADNIMMVINFSNNHNNKNRAINNNHNSNTNKNKFKDNSLNNMIIIIKINNKPISNKNINNNHISNNNTNPNMITIVNSTNPNSNTIINSLCNNTHNIKITVMFSQNIKIMHNNFKEVNILDI